MMGVEVRIGNTVVSHGWDGSSLTALDSLAITWGREDPYEAVQPGTLSASLIDPTGEWVSSTSLAGTAVTVSQTSDDFGSRVVFRGRLTVGKPERRKLPNPRTGVAEPVWVVQINAGDPLAVAASTVIVGPMGADAIEGLGGWGEAVPGARMTDLWSRGANKVFSGPAHYPGADVVGDGSVVAVLHGQSATDQRTILDLAEQAFRVVPLGVVSYDPADDSLRPGSYATASQIVLVQSAGVVTVQLPSGRVIDAGSVEVPNGLTAETTANDGIDVVQVAYVRYGKDPAMREGSDRTNYTNPITQATTARGRVTGGTRLLKYDTQAMSFDPTEYAAGAVDPQNRFVPWLLAELVKVVDTLNGQMKLPKLRFDDRRLPLPASVTAALYYPYLTTTPVYFAGSVFNLLKNAGPQYQIVGGTLRYERGGWTHDVNVIPARSAGAADLPLSALFGTSDATIAAFDDDIRIGDLANVTKGLTT